MGIKRPEGMGSPSPRYENEMHVSSSLNSFKGDIYGTIEASMIGVSKGATRSLDSSADPDPGHISLLRACGHDHFYGEDSTV